MATTLAPPRRFIGRCVTGVVAVALAASASLVGAQPAQAATETVSAVNSTLTITTAGWGHGRGMSQYGAQGAAKQGLSTAKILSFYYPGTKLEELPKDNVIRVWITADTDNKLHVYPAKGMRVRDSQGKVFTLPTGSKYTKWRISRSGSKRLLYYRNSSGKYVKFTNSKFKLDPKRNWYFDNPTTGTVKLYLASGNRTYRGSLALRFYGTGARTVNNVTMEDYLRSVVPSEMPASWDARALGAQTVAARTYAARYTVLDVDSDVVLGMSATVTIAGSPSVPLARLPLGALFDRGAGSAVWTVAADGGLTLSPVDVARYDGTSVYIRGGVEEGDSVVALGVHKLDAGQKVRVINRPGV